MTDRSAALSAFSIQGAKPDYVFGQIGAPPLAVGASAVLLRASIPPDVSRTATIVSATIVVRAPLAWSGSYTLGLYRNTAALKSTATWNSAPTYDATPVATVSKTNPPLGTDWSFDVTAEYQAFLVGTLPNYGFRLYSTSSTKQVIRGATAAWNQPTLLLTYAVPGAPASDLMPDGGVVGTAKPTVTFTAPDSTVSVNVQIDPAANPTTPAFDSGEVASTAGLLDLSTTAYAGLASGASTQWRARYKDADTGWAPWSGWATFSYTPLPTLTITTPDATPSDPTPTVSWTLGSTQTAWRVRVLDAAAKVLSDSRYQSGTTTAWTPPKAFTSDGQTGTIEVSARDGLDRIAVTGFPTWAVTTLAVTVGLDGTVPPMDTLTASQPDSSPLVTLSGTRSEIPDEVVIFRDGVRVARMPGTDVFTGTAFAWVDYTAPPNHPATYRVAPVTSGHVGAGGPTVTISPRCIGWWLLDPAAAVGAPDRAVAWDQDAGTWNRADVAAIHQTLDGAFVRRRLGRPLLSGTMTGRFVDAVGTVADDMIAALETWATYDAGYALRLVAGDLNIPVNIGDVLTFPTPQSTNGSRVSVLQVTFWQVDV